METKHEVKLFWGVLASVITAVTVFNVLKVLATTYLNQPVMAIIAFVVGLYVGYWVGAKKYIKDAHSRIIKEFFSDRTITIILMYGLHSAVVVIMFYLAANSAVMIYNHGWSMALFTEFKFLEFDEIIRIENGRVLLSVVISFFAAIFAYLIAYFEFIDCEFTEPEELCKKIPLFLLLCVAGMMLSAFMILSAILVMALALTCIFVCFIIVCLIFWVLVVLIGKRELISLFVGMTLGAVVALIYSGAYAGPWHEQLISMAWGTAAGYAVSKTACKIKKTLWFQELDYFFD
jgi:hypothetical protein